MKRVWLILAAFLGLMAAAAPASADVQYTLTYNSSSNTITNGHDYGTVTLHQDSGNTTTVRVTVQLKTSIAGIGFASTGAGYAIAFDLSGNQPTNIAIVNALTPNFGSFAVQTTSGNYLGAYKASPFTSGGNGNDFQYAIDYTGATNAGNTKLVFDVTRSTGLAISSFIANPNYMFAVDINTTALNTRNVASGTTSHNVPESGTLPITIAGFAGLMLLLLQRRRKLVRA